MSILKDLYLRLAFLVSVVLLLAGLAIAYVKLTNADYLLVIHFDAYRGIDFFGHRADVFGILWAGLAVSAINFLLAQTFYHRERFLAYLMAGFSVFLALLILIAVGVIISIN